MGVARKHQGDVFLAEDAESPVSRVVRKKNPVLAGGRGERFLEIAEGLELPGRGDVLHADDADGRAAASNVNAFIVK